MQLKAREVGRENNPLWNSNRMKLGIFGSNVSNGCAMTTAEGRLETVLQEAEDSGPATEMTAQDWADIEDAPVRQVRLIPWLA